MILEKKECEPCISGAQKLTNEQSKEYLKELNDWHVVQDENELKLLKKFELKNFEETMNLVNKVATLAQENGHHPIMLVEYRALSIWWWTHTIGGLHENDFIMAAKVDEIV